MKGKIPAFAGMTCGFDAEMSFAVLPKPAWAGMTWYFAGMTGWIFLDSSPSALNDGRRLSFTNSVAVQHL